MGQSFRQSSIVGKHVALTHTALSAAWLLMKRTASGPRVSYRGTDTTLTRVIAASSRHHSVQLMEYSPTWSPGATPDASNPALSAARRSYACLYVIHSYSRGVPSGDTRRAPNIGKSEWRLHVLSHTSCRVLTFSKGMAKPVISLVCEPAFRYTWKSPSLRRSGRGTA